MPEDLKVLQSSLNLKSIEAEAARAPTLARIAQERTDDLAVANGTIDDMKDANAAVKAAADAIKTAGAGHVTAEMITALDTAVAALALPAIEGGGEDGDGDGDGDDDDDNEGGESGGGSGGGIDDI